jgi:Lrp/AsnC family leucine-responsive transcriptional regulator
MFLKEVTECYNVSGDFDFLLKVMVKDMKHYQSFVLQSLGSVKNIGSAHSTFVMGEIKNNHGIPL